MDYDLYIRNIPHLGAKGSRDNRPRGALQTVRADAGNAPNVTRRVTQDRAVCVVRE